jgi:hypothetical protein
MMSILIFSFYMFFVDYKALFQSTNSQGSYFYFVVASHDMSCDHDIVASTCSCNYIMMDPNFNHTWNYNL